jgi:hypothetical protein
MRLTATLVARMRAAQKKYFRECSIVALTEAKQLEMEVDEAIAEIQRNQSISGQDND